MPTPESSRVLAHRHKYHDQVPLLVDRGGKEFFKALAALRGLTVSEMIRKAVMHDAGLHYLPFPDDMDLMSGIDEEDTEDILRRLLRIQNKERTQPEEVVSGLSGEDPKDIYVTEVDMQDAKELLRLCQEMSDDIRRDAARATDPLAGTVRISLTGRQISAMRRLIANRVIAHRHGRK